MTADSAGIDMLVEGAVFAVHEETRQDSHGRIRDMALAQGITPASTQGLYEAAGKGLYRGVTVPAINIRGLTYHVARAVFRAALRLEVGVFIFEIARSEIGYTKQRPGEYAACVLAAAVKEGFKGPVFIQGDHFQVNAAKYASEREKELKAIEDLIRESVSAGFLNIDVDASTLVDLGRPGLDEQQEQNSLVTARMTRFIRGIEPEGTPVSVGGEIGEVGSRNSTVDDLRAFMKGYLSLLGSGTKGISKISVQTGTTHGGVVLPDGSIAKVELDLKVLEQLSSLARQEYGMAGAVQHGASTLPDDAFSLFPQAGTAEVHLATGFQNIIYDSPHFPRELLATINNHLLDSYAGERKAGETTEQFLYKTRKRAFGDFKKEIWGLSEDSIEGIGEALEKQFSFLFQQLNVVNTVDLVKRYVAA
jgi:fructose/tagatose bisphosphate aldolase